MERGFLSNFSKLARVLALWVVAMAWHLWRVLSLRPAFEHVFGTLLTTACFIAMYFGAGWLRWVVLDDRHWAPTLIALVLWALLLAAVSLRQGRTLALWLLMLSASSVVDLLCAGLLMADAAPSGWVSLVVELLLYGNTLLAFYRLTPELQRSIP